MPKIEHAVAFTDEPGAEDHVRPIFQDRLDQPRVFPRVVLQIGVLDDNDVPGDMAKPLAKGGTFALIALLVKSSDLPRFHVSKYVAGPVGAAIVHENNFLGDRHGLDAAN